MIHIRIEPTQLALNQINSLSIILTNSADTACTQIGLKLRLPSQIVLLEGNDTIDLPKLDAFQRVTKTVRVRPKQLGTWIVGSSSFSYRDSRGQSQHPPPLHQEVKVIPVTLAPAISEPKVHVNLLTETLPFNEWDQLEGEIANVGNSTLYGVSYRVMGPVSKDTYTPQDSMDVLHPGETKRFQVLVKAEASGNKVPFHIEIACSDETGLRRTYDQLTPIRVVEHRRVENSQSLGPLHHKNNAAAEMNNMSVPKIFISYSHVDEKHMLRLVSMLKPLEKQGVFHVWHDRAITAGDEWYQEIQNAINPLCHNR